MRARVCVCMRVEVPGMVGELFFSLLLLPLVSFPYPSKPCVLIIGNAEAQTRAQRQPSSGDLAADLAILLFANGSLSFVFFERPVNSLV